MKAYKVINAYRIVPRLASVLFSWSYAKALVWYMEETMQTMEQTAFITGFTACVVGWFKFYVDSKNVKK